MPAPIVPLPIPDQAAALVTDFQHDLNNAERWNRYSLGAILDPQTHTLRGDEHLAYTNHDDQPLTDLYFHLYPNLPDFGGRLTINAITLDGEPQQVVYERNRYLLHIALPRPLAAADTIQVTLDFMTTVPRNASQTHYGAFNDEHGVIALASSYPIVAIVRHGVWDIAIPDSRGDFVNSETALYDVTLTAPTDWHLVTTGVARDQRTEGAYQITRFVSGPQRDFTISAVHLDHDRIEIDGTQITSYYRPNSITGGQAALKTAQSAIRAFNKRFGRYPLSELDIIQIDARTFLGVEYPGLIMIDADIYNRPATLKRTIAHEVAHQWWYSQIGNDVQTEAWIDEALASYAQIIYQEETAGPEAATRELDGFRQRYLDVLNHHQDAPIAQPTSAFGAVYVPLVYGKAVLFFQAIRQTIGDAAFDQFLHSYYAAHRYGIVTGTDVLTSAEGACACDLHGLYRDWIVTDTTVQVP